MPSCSAAAVVTMSLAKPGDSFIVYRDRICQYVVGEFMRPLAPLIQSFSSSDRALPHLTSVKHTSRLDEHT